MKYIFFLSIITSCLCLNPGFKGFKPDKHNIHRLNSDLLSDAQSFGSDIFWFVKFFGYGYPQCEFIAPTFISVAESFKENPGIKFGEVDCPGSGELCARNSIPQLPTMRLYHKGTYVEHTGLDDVPTLTAWIKEHMSSSGQDTVHSLPLSPPPTSTTTTTTTTATTTTATTTTPLTSKYITAMGPELLAAAQAPDSAYFWVIKFWRPNCTHCDLITPEFAAMADRLTSVENLRFGELNCLDVINLCTSNKILGVPAIRMYYKGFMADLEGAREATHMIAWVNEHMANDGYLMLHPPPRPPAPVLPTSEHIKVLDNEGLAAAKRDAVNFWVVKFKQNHCSHCVDFAQPFVDMVNGYAKRKLNLRFGEVDCQMSTGCQDERIMGVPAVCLYYRGARVEYRGSRHVSLVAGWIDEHMADNGALILHPLVSPYITELGDHKTYKEVVQDNSGPGSETFWVVRYSQEGCVHCKPLAPVFIKLANKLNATANLRFASIDCAVVSTVCDVEKVQSIPTIRIIYKGRKVDYLGVRNYEPLLAWVRATIANNGDAIFHQPAPPPPPRGAEYVENLNRTALAHVQGPNNTVFWVVKFSRHDCSHCEYLIPVYISLAESLNSSRVRFGEVDCTALAGLCNQNKIEGVPTIRLYYKGSYIEYNSTRTVENFTIWIENAIEDDGEKILHPPPPPPPPPTSRYITELNSLTLLDAKSPASKEFWVVKYYRRGCPHCDRLEPDFVSLADMLGTTANLRFGQLNCPLNGEVCNENDIKGVPTLRIYYRGEFLEYNGNRSIASMEGWIDAGMADDGDMIVNVRNNEL